MITCQGIPTMTAHWIWSGDETSYDEYREEQHQFKLTEACNDPNDTEGHTALVDLDQVVEIYAGFPGSMGCGLGAPTEVERRILSLDGAHRWAASCFFKNIDNSTLSVKYL